MSKPVRCTSEGSKRDRALAAKQLLADTALPTCLLCSGPANRETDDLFEPHCNKSDCAASNALCHAECTRRWLGEWTHAASSTRLFASTPR